MGRWTLQRGHRAVPLGDHRNGGVGGGDDPGAGVGHGEHVGVEAQPGGDPVKLRGAKRPVGQPFAVQRAQPLGQVHPISVGPESSTEDPRDRG